MSLTSHPSKESESAKAKRLLTFGYVSGLIIWTLLLIGKILLLFWTQNLSLMTQGSSFGFTDFVHFFLAGKITLSPQRNLFYSWDVQKQFLENITHCTMSGEDFYTQYVPPVFLLMAPYALLPINSAHLVFEVINLAIGLAAVWLLLKQLNLTKNRMAYYVVLGALASIPSWNTWFGGQISWLYLGIACFYLIFFLRRKDILAGLMLALSAIKPHYALFLLIPSLAEKRYRLIIFSALFEFLLLSICTAVFGLKAMISYPAALSQCEATFTSIKYTKMYGISTAFSFFLSRPNTHHLGLFILGSALIAVTAFVILRYKKPTTPDFKWLISLIILAALIFSPHSHSHDCLLLLIPALLTLPFYPVYPSSGTEPPGLRFWRWSFYVMPPFTVVLLCLEAYTGLPANLLLTALMIALFVIAARYFWREQPLISQ